MSDIREAVQSATGIALELRNSLHFGGDYFRGGEVGGEEVMIQGNQDEDGELIEDDFGAYPVLLRIDRSPKADGLREALKEIPGLEFLRRTTGALR